MQHEIKADMICCKAEVNTSGNSKIWLTLILNTEDCINPKSHINLLKKHAEDTENSR